jgi:quercetin dioxygenase-like cupin family protein
MTTELRQRPRWALAGAAVALMLGALLVLLLARAAGADHEPIHAVPLTTVGHNQFTDDVAVQVRDRPTRRATEVVNLRDASNLAVFRFTIQPGAWFPWHTHPGPVLAAVAQGELVFIYADDCERRSYGEGSAFVDPGLVHTAYNPSDAETVVIATVLGVAEGAAAATPVDPEAATAHNEACETPAPVPGGDAGPGSTHDH